MLKAKFSILRNCFMDARFILPVLMVNPYPLWPLCIWKKREKLIAIKKHAGATVSFEDATALKSYKSSKNKMDDHW